MVISPSGAPLQFGFACLPQAALGFRPGGAIAALHIFGTERDLTFVFGRDGRVFP
jgi:hypothetical protein